MTRLGLTMILLTLAAAPLSPAAAQDLLWKRQVGSTKNDFGGGAAVDSAGNAYVVGTTEGALGGTQVGGYDAFVIKYNSSGAVLWTRQLGTTTGDGAAGVAVDSAGNVYVAGTTLGDLGASNAGSQDAFLVKYGPTGAVLWTRQFGSTAPDVAFGVATDSAGNAYVAGRTEGDLGGVNAGMTDVFLAKYDAAGSLQWTRQIATATYEECAGVGVDGAGNVFVAGSTFGALVGSNLGDWDAFLIKYSASGALLWERQIGTDDQDIATAVAVDNAGDVYLSGFTSGNLVGPNAGGGDAFLSKYDPAGALVWARQLGTVLADEYHGVAVDATGNVYTAGHTDGSLAGPNAGGSDLFLTKHDAAGALQWARQVGTLSIDLATGVSVDSAGNAYMTGNTGGSLGGPNAGGDDVFLLKFGPPPCPADFNHDGFVTGDDFDSFVLAFVSGDAAADFDHNGFVTGDDFDAYVAAFEAGC